MSVLFNWNSIISAFSNDPLRSAEYQHGPQHPERRYGPPSQITLDAVVDDFRPVTAPGLWSAWNDRLVGTAIILGAVWILLIWGYLRRGKKTASNALPPLMLQNGDAKAQESRSHFERILSQRLEAIEQQVQKAAAVTKRVEALEARMKLDQDAIESMHRSMAQRMEALEEGIRTIDGKQLDMEASHIVQRGLSQRLETLESGLQTIDSKTRSASQRIESIDDSVRVIDSRTKAISQRVEAVEDSVGSIDGQATLLSHDLSRGSLAIEKLQRQVKMLPDAEKFKGLSRAWDTRFKKAEAKIEQYKTTLDETLAERAQAAALTLSPMDTQEIEPSGPYADMYGSYDFDMISPSPSTRSQSSVSHTRTYSTVSSSPPSGIPMTPERRRIEMAGFREMTFSSKQKQLHPRHSFGNTK
ncbi:hypothetical protein SLS62_008492 [Diatrype stigma]|uniref:Uncharacterized protein n=1 Tax=Diatrype stigma TaxID=117547 RepID=A0AAN9ULP6_9PEZI